MEKKSNTGNYWILGIFFIATVARFVTWFTVDEILIEGMKLLIGLISSMLALVLVWRVFFNYVDNTLWNESVDVAIKLQPTLNPEPSLEELTKSIYEGKCNA